MKAQAKNPKSSVFARFRRRDGIFAVVFFQTPSPCGYSLLAKRESFSLFFNMLLKLHLL